MKTSILGTLIGPSFNSNQNPEMPVTAVDLQNVVAAKPKKVEAEAKATVETKPPAAAKKTTETAKPKKPEEPKNGNVKSNPNTAVVPAVSLSKDDREKWIKDLLLNKDMNIDEIMEQVQKVDPEWKKLSVLQYLKKPGIVKNTSDKIHTYGYKA